MVTQLEAIEARVEYAIRKLNLDGTAEYRLTTGEEEVKKVLCGDIPMMLAVAKAAARLIQADEAIRDADKRAAEAKDDLEWAVYDKMAQEHTMEAVRHSDTLRIAIAPLMLEVTE